MITVFNNVNHQIIYLSVYKNYLLQNLKYFPPREYKRQMSQIIERGQDAGGAPGPIKQGMGEGSHVVVMNIPGHKVGLIIGKDGETIRRLQVCPYHTNSLFVHLL